MLFNINVGVIVFIVVVAVVVVIIVISYLHHIFMANHFTVDGGEKPLTWIELFMVKNHPHFESGVCFQSNTKTGTYY